MSMPKAGRARCTDPLPARIAGCDRLWPYPLVSVTFNTRPGGDGRAEEEDAATPAEVGRESEDDRKGEVEPHQVPRQPFALCCRVKVVASREPTE